MANISVQLLNDIETTDGVEIVYFDADGNYFFDNDHTNITEIFTVEQVRAIAQAVGTVISETEEQPQDAAATDAIESEPKSKGKSKKPQEKKETES